MNIKSLLAATFAVASMSMLSMAQTRTIEHEYSEFDAISVSDGFKVSFVESDGYSAKFKVNDAFESYVQCYVKAGTLYIGVDDKSIPKEVKKSFKGKNSDDPVLEATVYVPSLKAVTLSDNCTFSCDKDINAPKFTLELSGTSSVSNLNIHVAFPSALTVTLSSALTLTDDNSGSAELAINGQAETASVSTAGSAKLSLSGKANTLNVTGKGGSSKIDAVSVSVDDVAVSLDGAELTVTPGMNLSLDLGKGASVCYSGDPKIKIVKIQNASVTRIQCSSLTLIATRPR